MPANPDPIAELPLVLRREPFGGIVFDPFDGTMLELDHEAYEVARKTLKGLGLFFRKEKREMMRHIKQEVHWNRLREIREVTTPEGKPWASDVPVPSLSAPTLVDFQITDKCLMGCPHCYASSIPKGEHVPWEQIQRVVNQLHDCGVCQLAIGGGEPLLHPQIEDLLSMCHDKGIVPNLTTGGMELNDKNLPMLKKYCGAIGISMEGVGKRYSEVRKYKFEKFEEALDKLKDAGVPTVIQMTLSRANFDHLDEMAEFCLTRPELYGAIFLAYKPVGRGETYSQALSTLDAETVSKGLSRAFRTLSAQMRVGYDCCMTPGVAGVEAELAFADESNLEGCSALRGSVGISSRLDVIPCTFTWRHQIGNLKKEHLRDIWRNANAERFRQRIEIKSQNNRACSGCMKKTACHGGCPVMPLINCHRDHIGDPEQKWAF
jgi:radical SAM protein with 4Fe4S-binding SPASM domain